MRIYFSDFSIFLLILFILMGLLIKSKLGKSFRFYFVLFTLILSAAAFLFDPIKAWYSNGHYTDLVRFYQDIKVFRSYGFNADKTYFHTGYDNVPIVKVLVYFVSLIGIDGVLPLVTSFIAYGIVGKVLSSMTVKDQSVTNQMLSYCFYIFVILTNYKVVITNIRMPIGMTLFFLLTYLDFVQHRKNKLILIGYFCLCLIHFAFIPFVIIRLVTPRISAKNPILIVSIVFLFGLIISMGPEILNRIGGSYFTNILYKIDFYTKSSKSEYFEILIAVLGFVKIITLMAILMFINRYQHKIITEYRNMFTLSMLFVVMCLGSFWNYYLFMRMTNYLVYLITFWSIFVLRKSNSHNNDLCKRTPTELILLFAVVSHFFYYFLSYQYRVLCF